MKSLRSKGVEPFRGQKILQPGHPDALFLKKVDDLFQLSPSKHRPPTPFHSQNKTNKAVRYDNIFIFCSHYYRSKAMRRARQGRARAVDLPAGSYELARPGVAPPLRGVSTCCRWWWWRLHIPMPKLSHSTDGAMLVWYWASRPISLYCLVLTSTLRVPRPIWRFYSSVALSYTLVYDRQTTFYGVNQMSLKCPSKKVVSSFMVESDGEFAISNSSLTTTICGSSVVFKSMSIRIGRTFYEFRATHKTTNFKGWFEVSAGNVRIT